MSQEADKVAWVLVRQGRMLVARNHDRRLFFLPGGHREPGESDAQTLVREIREELTVAIDPATMTHVGTYAGPRDRPDETFRMIGYTAAHTGDPVAASEIAELAWFDRADRDRVTAAERYFFDLLLPR